MMKMTAIANDDIGVDMQYKTMRVVLSIGF